MDVGLQYADSRVYDIDRDRRLNRASDVEPAAHTTPAAAA